jgi:hypothetical protein
VFMSTERFCKVMARWDMRSVDDIMDVGGGWRYVASAMSKGSMG